MNAFGVRTNLTPIEDAISFSYFHPLSPSELRPWQIKRQAPLRAQGDVALVFDYVEGDAIVDADIVVVDPQGAASPRPFRAKGSKAGKLAIVLNENEAALCGSSEDALSLHGADVVVVKRGPKGATVFERGGATTDVPAYWSDRVFKIGSGDVFSAAFAHYWGEKNFRPADAADAASRSVASFVDYHALPLPSLEALTQVRRIETGTKPSSIYIASPFFDLAQRWMLEELCRCFDLLGANFFSPLHEVGTGLSAAETAKADLKGLDGASVVLAILDGGDPGSAFEVGYALSHSKRVIVLAERLSENHRASLKGMGCEIATDFTSAVYRAIWASLS